MNTQLSKADLLAQIRSEHQRLEAIVRQIPDERLIQPGVESGWAVKDVLAHLTWWEQRMLQILRSAARGEEPPSLLLPGEDWDTAIDRLNQEILAANRDRSLADVRESFDRSFHESVESIAALSERDLFDADGLGGVMGRPAYEIIAGNTYEHYQEHAEMIRAWFEGSGATSG